MSKTHSPNTSTTDDEGRRRSVFYVPLFESFDNYLPLTPEEKQALIYGQHLDTPPKIKRRSKLNKLHISDTTYTESESDISMISPDRRYRRPLSYRMSSNEALTKIDVNYTGPRHRSRDFEGGHLRSSKPRLRTTTSCEPRYDRIYSPLSTSISSQKLNQSSSNIGTRLSTSKAAIRNSNLSLIPDAPKLVTPNREKSKTLPQNLATPSPIRGSNSSTSIFRTPKITVTPESPNKGPKISGLNFIRRSRSTKLSRSNSLLRSITARYIEEGLEENTAVVTDLNVDYDKFVGENGGNGEVIGALIKKNDEQVTSSPLSLRRAYLDVDDEVAVHSGKK